MRPPESTLANVRGLEIASARPWFGAGSSVLELGGGNGYQARMIAGWGCDVVSIDVCPPSQAETRYFPVQAYDGLNIPFPSESFDVVFSSCVLEHVKKLVPVLTEVRRVLTSGGIAIHVTPSPVWRFWTCVTHYGFLLKNLPGFVRRAPGNPANQLATQLTAQYGLRHTLAMAAFPGPHGEYRSAIHELYCYSRSRWLKVFARSGFEVVEARGNELFYTGNTICGSLSKQSRHVLGRLLGSSMYIFVTRPKQARGSKIP